MQILKPFEIESSHRALSEYESKKLLVEYGIPTADEILVQSRDQAVAAAKKIGFPVVLKACSPELMHKSEAGCVELSLTSDDDVAQAYDRILSSISVRLEGVLVSEMISGVRELVLGLTREPQFGPCVMLGLGGVMTEIFKDTVFRVAPFDRVEAEDMVSELKSKAMLNEFRGESPADINTICRCLISLGKIGLENPDISEIDINPLKIDPDGRVKAVDALVVFNRPDSSICSVISDSR
ncbi:MAG: carboxylate--amine ligase [Desulfobacteraceae bacterium]|nr:acetate--CoA ligase family protein [Desulfobacteraceae bacterium]MBC2757511.1 carboxylate--amine ligase [Desulfobacteraceae bacterium]